jgi:uncharacterized protein YqgC (DUF456 family)
MTAMEQVMEILQATGVWAGYGLVLLLCVVGVLLSCLSLFGAWVVAGAALLAAWLSGPAYPNIPTVIGFCVVAGVLELIEAVASAWGVSRRGGSKWAGFASLVGGLVGMILMAPLMPVLGSLVGMMLGGFAAAYGVEYLRLQRKDHAAHIAWGAVLGRAFVIFVKVVATVGMVTWLLVGIVVSAASSGAGSA